MKRFSMPLILAAVILAICGTILLFRAEAVEHHGFTVNAEGLHGGSYKECLVCHCDVIAPGPPPCMPVCLIGQSHPVNQSYPPAHRKNDFRTIEDAEQLGVVFVDGKTDCISCHDLKKKEVKYHLRFEKNQKFCETCHNKM
jgi:predicted CXXCH cytochrome family protein